MITYRKTQSEEWVACGPLTEMQVGTVRVQKRDGTSKNETIVSLGKPFNKDGVQHCYGHLVKRQDSSPSRAAAPRGTVCEECGTAPAVTTAVDSSGILGRVCGRCARLPQCERSFA